MMKRLFLVCTALCLSCILHAQYDTLFLRYDIASGAGEYKTDTVLFSSEMMRNYLVGTTILPNTHRQMAAKGYGLDLRKVVYTECENGPVEPSSVRDRITSVSYTDSLLVVDIVFMENCCYDFLCEIDVDDAGVLDLVFTGYGQGYCGCTCCFGLTYYIERWDLDDLPELRSVRINGDPKTLQALAKK
ncbi:MAG: hypothetical protein IBJ09_08275 [Bacteroidia bacterium]|nr:hypothetical protein [Bacteroidia bacterium]